MQSLAMAPAKVWDVAVIGAGIVGTSAAYHAARLGFSTIKIDQFAFGHDKGSSHGCSRITRMAHTEAAYIPIVADTYKQIEEMEAKRNEELWINCGLLWVGAPARIDKIYKTCIDAGCNLEMLTHDQMRTRFPLFKYDDSWRGIYDPRGGSIHADRWQNAFHDEFLKAGGTFQGDCEVTSITRGSPVTLATSQGEIKAKHLIIAAGSWMNKMLPELNVQAKCMLMNVCYWKPRDEKDAAMIDPANMPVFIAYDKDDNGREYFAVPPVDYPGAIKFIDNSGGDVFASGGAPEVMDDIFVRKASEHIAKHVPAISDKPIKVDRCKYTMSPDHHYLIDYIGDSKNIVVCGMMSGSGFKMSPGLGRGVVHMVTGLEMPFDLSFFGAKRFGKAFGN